MEALEKLSVNLGYRVVVLEASKKTLGEVSIRGGKENGFEIS